MINEKAESQTNHGRFMNPLTNVSLPYQAATNPANTTILYKRISNRKTAFPMMLKPLNASTVLIMANNTKTVAQGNGLNHVLGSRILKFLFCSQIPIEKKSNPSPSINKN